MNKKTLKLLLDTTKSYLESIGATKVDDITEDFCSYQLETKVGNLNINIDLGIKSTIFSIFCGFDNVDAAKKVVACNPYSGKYNLHVVAEKLTVPILEESLYNHFDCLLTVYK